MSQSRHLPAGEAFAVLGLSVVEERVYRELVRRRSATAAELASAVALSAPAIQRAVDVLLQKGFVSWTTGSRRRLLAAPPAAAIDVIAFEIERQLQGARIAGTQLAAEWTAAPHERAADELVEIITGREAMSRRFESLISGARTEILGFNAAPLVVDDAVNLDINAAALARGVEVRSVYERQLLEQPGVVEMIAAMQSRGEQARVIGRLPNKLVIVDGTTALLPVNLDLPDPAPTAALVHGPIARVLTALFAELWRRSVPVRLGADDDGWAPDPEWPAPAELTLLSLLISGLSDDGAARRLGISRRTIHRQLQRLQQRFGVSGRLELVWLAGHRGWLDDPRGSRAADSRQRTGRR